MPFSFNRGLLKLILINGLVLLVLAGIFTLVRHIRANRQPVLSEKILITPGASDEPETVVDSPAPVETPAETMIPKSVLEANGPTSLPQFVDSTPQTIEVQRLLSKSVTVTPYKLDGSDNYWTVADDHGISLYTLIGANPTLPFKAHLGLNVLLINRKGVLHTVYPGETLETIAEGYRIDPAVLKKENVIHWWRGIKTGDVLFIPDVKPIRMLKEWQNYFSQRGFFGVPFAHWGEAVTSGFGWRHDPLTGVKQIHTGMDFRAKVGESVYASATGKVIYAGVLGGYGMLIKIHHNREYTTYYGHLSKILVHLGQKVKRGQLIGKTGATGHVTGPHLHFEIRRYGVPINPLPLI
jgi:hypothetical protein